MITSKTFAVGIMGGVVVIKSILFKETLIKSPYYEIIGKSKP